MWESFKQVKFFLNKSSIIFVVMFGENLVLCYMCCLVWMNQFQNICVLMDFRKPEFPAFNFTVENPFQNRSTFWGWDLKQKCRACWVVQSLFLEFSKLFRKFWSNLKRRNVLKVSPFEFKFAFQNVDQIWVWL